MSLVQISNANKQYGTKVLFNQATFAVNQSEHVGVIGPNGAGKSTLFKILVGKEQLDSGEIHRARNLRLGYLEQESEWNLNLRLDEYLETECIKPIWELKQLGRKLGLTEAHFATRLDQFSGGYRMRAKLLYLLGLEPDLMLLDEPTNFLDLESVLVLENFLQDFSGALLLISHDREFLQRTTEFTLEVEDGEITKFPGSIDDYFEQKSELQSVLAAQAKNIDARRKHLQAFVDRFRAKATKAKQAQSRMKQLDKLTEVDRKRLPARAKIRIPEPIATGRESIALTNATLGYDNHAVLSEVQLRVERGTHLGVVGINGAGKSTLLKSLAGELPLVSGTRTLGHQVHLAYYSQHSVDQLDFKTTVIDNLQSAAHRDLIPQDILNMAGSLLFSGDDVHKPVHLLSGGEKSRVALGQVLLRRSPLLLLDEPTNHLDFDTVEALTQALQEYPGTVILVSHDRGFVGRVATQILEINHGKIRTYPGTYDEYIWSVQKGVLGAGSNVTSGARSAARSAAGLSADSSGDSAIDSAGISTPAKKFNFKAQSKELQSKIKEFGRQISKCEERLHLRATRRDELNNELLTVQGERASLLAKELADCSQDVQNLEEELLLLMEQQQVVIDELSQLKETGG